MGYSPSRQGLVRFKKLIQQDGLSFTDEEIHEMASRLLALASAIGSAATELEAPNVTTPREQEALVAIRDYFKQHSCFPSARELSRLLGYRSSRSGHELLYRLRTRRLLDQFRSPVSPPNADERVA